MEQTYSKKIKHKCDTSTKDKLLQILDALHNTAVECGVDTSVLIWDIKVDYGDCHAKFESIEELEQSLPPLTTVNKFEVRYLHNPYDCGTFNGPEVSFDIAICRNSSKGQLSISATASSLVDAQELVLAVESFLQLSKEKNGRCKPSETHTAKGQSDTSNQCPNWGRISAIATIVFGALTVATTVIIWRLS